MSICRVLLRFVVGRNNRKKIVLFFFRSCRYLLLCLLLYSYFNIFPFFFVFLGWKVTILFVNFFTWILIFLLAFRLYKKICEIPPQCLAHFITSAGKYRCWNILLTILMIVRLCKWMNDWLYHWVYGKR